MEYKKPSAECNHDEDFWRPGQDSNLRTDHSVNGLANRCSTKLCLPGHMVSVVGLEPTRFAQEPKPCVSAIPPHGQLNNAALVITQHTNKFF